MMIMGIPNVGKSTLMNVVLQRKLAKVGDEPAVTRAQQTSQLDVRHSITDTPGLLWPKIEHPSDGLMLAASHAVGRNAMIDEEVATFLAGLLLARYPALLAKRYGFPADAGIEHRCGGGHRRDRQTPRPAHARRRSRSRESGEECCCRITGMVCSAASAWRRR
jgi:ribosome biogenesis GTPase A